jgi:hypothetical protein
MWSYDILCASQHLEISGKVFVPIQSLSLWRIANPSSDILSETQVARSNTPGAHHVLERTAKDGQRKQLYQIHQLRTIQYL